MKKFSLVLSIIIILNVIFSSFAFAVTEATITATANGTALSSSKVTKIEKGQTISIVAKHSSGIKEITYAFDEDPAEYRFTYNSSATSQTKVIAIPNEYKDGEEHTLYVYAQTGEGKYNEDWIMFKFKVVTTENTVLVPYIQIKANDINMNDKTVVAMDSDDKIYFNVSAANGIKKVIYAFDNDAETSKSTGEFSIDVPSKYKDGNKHTLLVQAMDKNGAYSVWYTYYFKVIEKSVDPTFTLKQNSTTMSTGKTYTLKTSDKLNATASHSSGISKITYVFDNDAEEYYINGASGTINIPDKYKDGVEHTLLILVESKAGTFLGWLQYKFKYEITKPTISAKTESTSMNQKSVYVVNLNQKINISAESSDGIKNIVYKIDDEAEKTTTNSKIDITAENKYNDGEAHTITVKGTSKSGAVSDTHYYYFKIKKETTPTPQQPETPKNTKYDVITQPDEKVNNVHQLAVSLRNVSNVNGNKNRYVIGEYANYNIDFVNGGATITGTVTLTFNIPENVTVNFIDAKGGQVSGRMITWTFNGLESGECGTIPVVLSYTNISGDYQTVKPIARITAGKLSDVSAVQNLVYKANTTLKVNHKPYMYGDAKVDTFRPNDGINRAEMAAVIVRVFELNRVQNYTVTYKDANTIADDLYRWSTQDIMTVTQYGIMEGYEDGTFRPGNKVTKAEYITVLARLFTSNNTEGFVIKDQPIKQFASTYSTHWAMPYVSQLTRLNMVGNALKASENPDQIITRAEVAHLMNLAMFRGPSNTTTYAKNFKDVNSSTQYYTDILEATSDEHSAKFTTDGMEIMVK